MMDALNYASTLMYVKATNAVDNVKAKAAKAVKEFKEDERGVDGLVVAILLILVVVILAAVFWDNIAALFKDIWDRIFAKTGEDSFNADDAARSQS